MSERYDCTEPIGRTDGILAAGTAVRKGQLVVLPTDTVYGIGCDAFDADAVAAVLAAKGRGRDMPPPVLIPTARTAQGLATEIPDYALTLMERFWPGPLTVILKAQSSLHWDLGDTNGTVALRVPDNEIALQLLSDVGPMAVTSANLTGEPAARSADDAERMLGESVEVYLDGGPALEGDASTIVDCTGAEPVTLRHGALSQEDIDEALAAAPEPEPEPDLEAELNLEARPEPHPEPHPETGPMPQLEPQSETEPPLRPAIEAEPDSDPAAASDAEDESRDQTPRPTQ